MRRPVLVALLLLVAGPGWAQTCYEWRLSSSYDWTSDPRQVAADVIAMCTTSSTTCGLGSQALPRDAMTLACTFSTFPSISCSGTSTKGGSTVAVLGSGINRTNPLGCPSCPPVGTDRSMVMESGPASIGDSACGSDGCTYDVVSPARNILLASGFQTVQAGRSTGIACASNANVDDSDHQPASEDCVDASGMIACLDPGPGCGYFNGDYVCTQHVPDDACVSFASGGVACVAGSPDAPKDAMDDPLPPDGTVTRGDKEVDYYAPTTTASAATPATTVAGIGGSATGAPGADGSSGGGLGGGGTVIECVGEDCVTIDLEGECPEGETCEGTLPGDTPGEFAEVCTFGECAADFYDRVLGSPLLSSMTGVGAAWPSGSCPSWTIEALENEYSLSAPMCQIWDDISPFLSGVFILVWAWVATRIFLSA